MVLPDWHTFWYDKIMNLYPRFWYNSNQNYNYIIKKIQRTKQGTKTELPDEENISYFGYSDINTRFLMKMGL